MDLRDGRYITPSTPATQVFFDTTTPTTEGVIFDPNTPALADTLYVSSTNSSTWIYQDGAYITYTAPVVNNTEWYITGTTIDAGSSKTVGITRSGNITVGSDSTFSGIKIGRGAGGVTTNTLFGLNSLVANTSGSYNTAIGRDALTANTTGFSNTAIGSRVLYTNLGGQQNVAIGDTAMYFNTSGTNNVAVGINSLYRNTTGGNNTALGYQAGSFLADGTTNNTAPDSSVFIGSISRAKTINDVNQIVIGYNAIGKGSNTTVIGNTSTTDTYLQGGSGVVSWAVAGLSFFTEAQATASPNDLVYANSLTAVATTTNADYVMVAKGSGAILARIPDGTGTGGNKRGLYALDLSRYAGASGTYIAAGNYDIILGGTRNISNTGTYSFIANGDFNSCTGQYGTILNGNNNSVTGARGIVLNGSYSQANGANSIAGGGAYNYANGGQSVALCNGTTASGTGSMSINQATTASGQNSFAAGNGSTADAINGFAIGDSASTNGIRNKFVIGGSGYSVGATQAGIVQLDGRTTNTTPTVLQANTQNSGGITAATQFTLPNNSLMRVKGSIQGKQSGSTNVGVWDFDAVLVRGTTASTMTVVISNINVVTNIPVFGTPTITANTSLGCMTVTVTGLSATNIQWACRIDSTETLYA